MRFLGRAVFAILLVASSWVVAAPYNRIVVFGDSLSDNGNLYEYMKHQLPLSPPYYKGRFTNGPVWVELLADHYFPVDSQSHLLDYAFGGAGVSEGNDDDDDSLITLRSEVDSFLLAHQGKADENSLYVVWAGSNNYLAVPDDVEQSVKQVIAGIKVELKRLASQGAKTILVVNVPDLGKIPAARDFESEALLTQLSLRHNETIKQEVQSLEAEFPGVKWLLFDVNQMFKDMLSEPSKYGFTNLTDTCYEEAADEPSSRSVLKLAATITSNENQRHACDGYLFFDPVHPAELAHIEMLHRIKILFDQAGIVFG